MPVDVLLWDLGNVLVSVDFPKAGRRFAELTGRAYEEVFPLLRTDAYLAFERGELTPDAFFERLAADMGGAPSLERCREAYNDIFELDSKMVGLVSRLVDHYPSFLWSNTSSTHLSHLRARLPVLERFEGLHVSFELGAMKPSPAFYEAALAKGRLVPERCVFVDDLEANVRAAEAFGIRGIVHSSAEETVQALARLGVDVRAG